MKKLLFIFCLLSSLPGFSQDEAAFFLKANVYVVKTESPFFDSSLKAILDKQWALSKISGYITRKELKDLVKSPENAFIDPTTRYWEYGGNINSSRSASGIFFYLGKTKKTSLADAFIILPFGHLAGEASNTAVYRLELMLRTAASELTHSNNDSVKKIYNLALLKKKKVLLVNNTQINNKRKRDDCFEKDAFEDYPYKVEFASPEQIAIYIKDKNKKYALAVPIVSDLTRTVHIYDVETGFYIGGFERSGAFALPLRKKDLDNLLDNM